MVAGYSNDIYFAFKYDAGDISSVYVRLDVHGEETGLVEPGEGDYYFIMAVFIMTF